MLSLLVCCTLNGAQAFDLGGLNKAREAVGKGQEAVSTGQEAYSTGKDAVEKGQQVWDRRGNLVPGTSTFRSSPPGGPAPIARDEGGPTRLIAVLGEGVKGPGRSGRAVVGLLDRGVYFVQRQSAFAAPAQGQILRTARPDSTNLSLELPVSPVGTVFDLSAGRSSPSGRGVRIYTLSVHADVPQRRDRKSLDTIEQHALLRASSVQMEWPRSPQDILEPVGGKLLVHASESGVAFPSGFGVDGKLFTKDDPMVSLPRGYTVVNLDPRGFIFDRSREVVLPLHDVMSTSDIDLTRLSYADAFQAFCSLMNERYPYLDTRPVDWKKAYNDLASAASQAGSVNDATAYARVYHEVGSRLQDGQYRVRTTDGSELLATQGREQGLSIRRMPRGDFVLALPRVWLSQDGKGWITDVAPNSPAALAGLRPGAEILEVDGENLTRQLERLSAPSGRGGAEQGRALDALLQTLLGKDALRLTVRQEGREQTLELRLNRENPFVPEPVTASEGLAAFQLRSAKGGDFGYIGFNSFSDGSGRLLAWEQAMTSLSRARIPGLIVDLRGNGAGSHELVAHFLASFFSYDKPLRPQGYAQRQLDPSSKVWRTRGGLGLPAQLPLFAQDDVRYAGRLVLLTDRSCSGPCEIFASWLQRAGRAYVIGTEPTAGAVGHLARIHLPAGLSVDIPVVSELMASGDSYVDGKGVSPDLRVIVDRDFISRMVLGGDPVLDAAVQWLDTAATKQAK